MSSAKASPPNDVRVIAQKLLAADYFVTLGVQRTASPEDVRKAFLEQVKTWHPDRVPAGQDDLKPLFAKVFGRLELARATLSTPARKQQYLEDLAKPVVAATPGDLTSAEGTLELRKAEVHYKKNELDIAETHLRRAVELDPDNVEAKVLLVWLQAKPDSSKDQLRELTAELGRVIAKTDKSERAFFFRGQLRKRLDLVKEAHSDFVKAAAINPKNVDAAREVRIYTMRQERASAPGGAGEPESGALRFFKKLFKR